MSLERLRLVTFAPDHLDAAAELLAARHRRDREREPELPLRFEEAAATRPLIEREWTQAGPGVAAFRGERMVGFLVPRLDMHRFDRVAFTQHTAHAVGDGEGDEVYREMYAALAPQWLARGCFSHAIEVPAGATETLQTWSGLGFGRMGVIGWRDLRPIEGTAGGVDVRECGDEDVQVVVRMRLGLRRYNAAPPLLQPFVPPGEDELRLMEKNALEGLKDPRAVHLAAYVEREPRGLMTFAPLDLPEMQTLERGIHLHFAFVESDERAQGIGSAMLEQGLAWARERGYERCSVGWWSPNLIGARFWLSRGFKPLGFRLERRIDPRISWATGEPP